MTIRDYSMDEKMLDSTMHHRETGMAIPPPKADEELAHLRHLPRMGKSSSLRVLCASVVNP